MSPPAQTEDRTTKAVIYCRVSSKKQVSEGAGLESQEHRCREYAQAQGYEVEAVFPDDASGGGDFMNRPGMVALLAYLEARSDTDFVIIFDDLKRFARDIEPPGPAEDGRARRAGLCRVPRPQGLPL